MGYRYVCKCGKRYKYHQNKKRHIKECDIAKEYYKLKKTCKSKNESITMYIKDNDNDNDTNTTTTTTTIISSDYENSDIEDEEEYEEEEYEDEDEYDTEYSDCEVENEVENEEENIIYKVIDNETQNVMYSLTKPDELQETTLDTITDTRVVNFLKLILQKCDSLQEQLYKQNEQLNEISTQPKTVTNTIIQKNTFNLFQFLDNDCKNALNFSDFLENMVVRPEDLEYLHKHGYLKSVEYVVVQQLIEMEQCLRPLHCLDQKRKRFIVKERDIWHKEMFPECIDSIIDTYAKKQLKQYSEWQERNPDWRENDEKNEIGMILSMEIFRPFRREMKEKVNNKITNYLTALVIDKSQYNGSSISQKQKKKRETIQK